MRKITPFLWFDTQAEIAIGFYTSILKSADKEQANRVTHAILQMVKLNFPALQRVFDRE